MSGSILNNVLDRKIIAYDLDGNKHEKNLTDFKFRISVYGILVDQGKILLQKHPSVSGFGLPGGGIELGETIADSLIREFQEETGIIIKIKELVDVTQDFFTYQGNCAHSILIFYQVEKISGELTTNDDDSDEVKYFEINELQENNVRRVFWPVIKKMKDLR